MLYWMHGVLWMLSCIDLSPDVPFGVEANCFDFGLFWLEHFPYLASEYLMWVLVMLNWDYKHWNASGIAEVIKRLITVGSQLTWCTIEKIISYTWMCLHVLFLILYKHSFCAITSCKWMWNVCSNMWVVLFGITDRYLVKYACWCHLSTIECFQ